MDETGLALGKYENNRVIRDSRNRVTMVKEPPRGNWVTIIKAVSAVGAKIRPTSIFKGKALQESWFHETTIPDWLYSTSENRWTSNKIGTQWLEKVFIPETEPEDAGNRMLILDCHAIHLSTDFLYLAYMACIELIFFALYPSFTASR